MNKIPSLARFPLWLLLATLAVTAAVAHSATLDVTTYGAVANGTTDDTTAIQNAINAAAAGDTIYFPGGTYLISSTLTLVSNRNYAGEFAGSVGSVLEQSTANAFVASTQYDAGATINITGLTFENGGLDFAGSGSVPATAINVQYCTFENINNTTYPFNEGIYIPIGATNCNFVSNTFYNIMQDTGFMAWDLATCTITDNSFNTVNEGIKLNGTCTNTVASRNTGVIMHRMGIETQGSGYENFLVEDNAFSDWPSSYDDSFGLSIVPQSGPDIVTQYNTILGRPGPPSGSRYGYGIEVGYQEVVQNNFTEGYFWFGIVLGGANATIASNVVRGLTNGAYQQPSQIAYESGGDPTTAEILNNTQVNTANYVGAPSSLTASTNLSNQVVLNWVNNTPSPTGFQVQRRYHGGMYSTIATLAAGATSYTDTTSASNQAYIYRIYANDSSGDFTYSPAVNVASQKFEAENLTAPNYYSASGGTEGLIGWDGNLSNNNGVILDSDNVGDYVTFLIPNVSAGTYDIRVGVKNNSAHGQFQLQGGLASNFSGTATNIGGVVDEYGPDSQFMEVDLGNWSPATTNNKWFRFNVVGKNSASGGGSYPYSLVIDYVKMVPQNTPIGGSLTGNVALGLTSTYDLTTNGTADWVHWNGTYVHDASGGGQISNVTQIGGGNYGTGSGNPTWNVSWTNGTPTASNSDGQTFISCNDKENAGWTFTAPASTTFKTLVVLYGGTPGCVVNIKAHLSDSSAPDFTNTQTISSTTPNVGVFTYAAASTSQTLTITLTKVNDSGSDSVDLSAAWLQ